VCTNPLVYPYMEWCNSNLIDSKGSIFLTQEVTLRICVTVCYRCKNEFQISLKSYCKHSPPQQALATTDVGSPHITVD